MKTKLNHLFTFAVWLSFLLTGIAGFSQSVPALINYQGQLTSQTGVPLPAGLYAIQFRIWDSPIATGTSDLIWEQQQSVTVQANGIFDVILGSPSGSSIPGVTPAVNNLAYAFIGSNCFLGVTVAISNGIAVSGASEILPRQQLLSVPFAFSAQQAAQAQVAFSLVSNLANALSPPGTIVAYMGIVAPPGWLLCDGSLVSRTNYGSLYGVIGNASGSGDGSTTFNLPDLRGVFLRGLNGSRSDSFSDPDDITFRTNIFSGGNSGNAIGSYQLDALVSHNHSVQQAYYSKYGTYQSVSYTNLVRCVDEGWGAVQTLSTGGRETRPKNVNVNYIIKY